MNSHLLNVIYPIVLVALGWFGYGILSLNSKKHFLSNAAYTFLNATSLVFNLMGAFFCFKELFKL
jgi:hypothetical protein